MLYALVVCHMPMARSEAKPGGGSETSCFTALAYIFTGNVESLMDTMRETGSGKWMAVFFYPGSRYKLSSFLPLRSLSIYSSAIKEKAKRTEFALRLIF